MWRGFWGVVVAVLGMPYGVVREWYRSLGGWPAVEGERRRSKARGDRNITKWRRRRGKASGEMARRLARIERVRREWRREG
jgi:hypothetical protein